MSLIEVKTKGKIYPVDLENGNFGKIAEKIAPLCGGKKIFLLTDDNLLRLYGERLRAQFEERGVCVVLYSIKPGESSKALSSYEEVCGFFIGKGIGRKDCILAFGGGVVGDLAGFAAATIHRGLSYIQVPTSVIAQTDSSVGGKTGINLSCGKNLIGAFHHPEIVIVDPTLLASLPQREKRSGMAEIIKCALIGDLQMLRILEETSEDKIDERMPELIVRCLSMKASLVSEDEQDWGGRVLLNFGHTIGHAIETLGGYQSFSHGEAVAIGMSRITKASEEKNFTQTGTYDRIKTILGKYHLPDDLEIEDRESLVAQIGRDKKTEGEEIRLVLLKTAGEAFLQRVPLSEISDFI
ncbi:MAG: 3-dehydroquinate synthase [Peptostreptococcaceae bacterium]|nr:3-dehydroquinate synthase [Peptostreptococcaceae bacterium]